MSYPDRLELYLHRYLLKSLFLSGIIISAMPANSEDFQLVLKAKSQKRKIVFTNGCFDILHPGHIHLLNKAKELGDVLVVGLNSDESVRRLKGAGRPVFSQQDRKRMLLALRYVDAVIIFDEDTPKRLIEEVQPDVLVKGEEYEMEEIVGADFVIRHGGKVVRVKMLEGYSTSSIINKLKKVQ